MKTKLSIITVTFNSESVLPGYLRSLKWLDTSVEVIVVDNDSQDKSVDILNQSQLVKVIESTTNLGFGEACNLAAKYAQGEWLLFLNPDAELTETAVKKLLDFGTDHDDSLIAPKLVMDDGHVQDSVTNFPTVGRAIQEYWFGQKGSYQQYQIEGDQPVQVEAVYGAAWLIKRELFLKVGGFDKKFFLYYEDIDFCKRWHGLGYKVWYLPEVIIKHQLGASSKTVKKFKLNKWQRQLALFWPMRGSGSQYYLVASGIKYFGWGKATLIKLIIFFGQKLKNK